MTTHRAFLEFLTYSLSEEYRFPVLELFAFLYVLGAFAFASLSGLADQFVTSENGVAFALINSMTGLPVFILVTLMAKNIAFGLGSDLEKGTVQTFLAYPIRRRSFLAARVLPSAAAGVLLFLGTQVFALLILVPDVLFHNTGIVLFAYGAVLGYPLFVVALALISVLLSRQGSIAVVVAVMLYFVSGVVTPILVAVCSGAGSQLPLKACALVNPFLALQQHFRGMVGTNLAGIEYWSPSLNEAFSYLAACYALVALIVAAGFLYFERRLQV